MLRIALYFFLVSTSFIFVITDETDDIEDPDNFSHERFERNDYSIGGPLAKENENLTRISFERHKQTRHKNYSSKADEEQHYQSYRTSINRVKELNAQRQDPDDATFGETKFADKSFANFSKKHTGARKEPKSAEKFQYDVNQVVTGVPQKFDWRTEGVVPPIRNQHECGACYAFSTSDLVATQWAIDHNETKSDLLAPQYVLDCVKEPSAFGCDGGRPYLVLQSSANCTGENCAWAKESCYPYKDGSHAQCRESTLKCTHSPKNAKKIDTAYYLDVSNQGSSTEKDRLAALLHGGPVVALVTVTDHWQHYKGGVMRPHQCKKTDEPNHAVLIVGYDYTHPKAPHYIVRNSWDTDWGDDGYFKIQAGNNTCGIAQYLSFACTYDCGEGRNATHLLHRARRKLEKRGIKQEPHGWKTFKGETTGSPHSHTGATWPDMNKLKQEFTTGQSAGVTNTPAPGNSLTWPDANKLKQFNWNQG